MGFGASRTSTAGMGSIRTVGGRRVRGFRSFEPTGRPFFGASGGASLEDPAPGSSTGLGASTATGSGSSALIFCYNARVPHLFYPFLFGGSVRWV